jgi:hypothetical protein
MSHSPSQRARDRELARRRAESAETKSEQREAARAYAMRIVALWNARARRGRPASSYPTLRTALDAGTTLLTFMCPACQQVGEFDLRTVTDRLPPQASLSVLIPALSCTRCSPNAPFARLIGLADRRAVCGNGL